MTTMTSPSIPAFVAGLGAALLALGVQAQGLTRDNGAPVGDNQNSQTAGPDGPVLLQDVQFDPEAAAASTASVCLSGWCMRAAPARMASSWPRPTCLRLTRAKVFANGTRTPVFVRFSTVVHGNHSPETLRDPRGFATKFYTSEGNWDLVGNNLPGVLHPRRDQVPGHGPQLEAQPRQQPAGPEPLLRFLLARAGSHAHADAPVLRPGHAGQLPHHGRQRRARLQVRQCAGPGHLREVPLEEPAGGERTSARPKPLHCRARPSTTRPKTWCRPSGAATSPKWDLYVQLLKPEQLDGFEFNPLDATKVWTGVAERKVGTLTLNRNPANVFQETEQAAFAPGNLVPGIEPSEDRLLQGRVFSYNDTQLYRVWAPMSSCCPSMRPGPRSQATTRTGPPTWGSARGQRELRAVAHPAPGRRMPRSSTAASRSRAAPSRARIAKTLNFRQAGEFYRSLAPAAQANLVSQPGR